MIPAGALRESLGLGPAQAAAALWAARIVTEADGPPGPQSARLLAVLAHALGAPLGEGDAAAGLGARHAAVLEALPAPQRRRLVEALLIPACIEGEVSPGRQAAVERLARQLGVRSPWVALLGALRRRRVGAVRRALGRRSPDLRRLLSRLWAEEGPRGLVYMLRFMLGRYRDPALSARYRALRDLPPGTFGRAVADHFAARGLAFPGERGGMPERMIHHDLLHVLGGHDTDAAGECALAGLYAAASAGRGPGDPLTFLVTALATFQLGLPVSPAVVTPARGAFDSERVLAGFLQGRALRIDVLSGWDHWSLLPQPIGAVRRQLGLAP